MISKYFKELDKKLIKKRRAEAMADHEAGKASRRPSLDVHTLAELLSGIIPSHLTVDAVKPIDTTGFSPDGIDLIAYQKYCPDIVNILGGYVPYELVYGTYHLVHDLNKESLTDLLGKTATAKKLNMFATNPDAEERMQIPSFAIAATTKYQFIELKNDIINYYLSKNVEYQHEIDMLMVLHKGIVVKNWREKRSFIALETNEDTFMWFFILMNEYLDVKREQAIDFRKYVKKEVVYNEF
jgi:hypothetical protein